MLMSQVQAASLEARKSKNTAHAAVLVTLFAEMQKVGKDAGNRETTDDEAVRVVKKFLKGIDEFISVTRDQATLARLHEEKALYESFMPKQADEATLRATVADIVAGLTDKGPKAMGNVMKVLKERLAGNYDGALASRVVKDSLTG